MELPRDVALENVVMMTGLGCARRHGLLRHHRRLRKPASAPEGGGGAYQRIRPLSVRPCSAGSVRLSLRSPSRPISKAGPSRKRAPSR